MAGFMNILFRLLLSTGTYEDKPPLLFSTIDGVLVRDGGTWDLHKIIWEPTEVFMAVDFHWEKNYVFYADFPNGNLYRAKMTNNEPSEIITVVTGGPMFFESVTVDWVHDKIYWFDYNRNYSLNVANLDGTMSKTFPGITTSVVRKMTIDPLNKYIYFTSTKGIERIGLDGSGRKVVLSNVYNHLKTYLAVDFKNDRIFYNAPFMSTIRSVKTDGTDDRVELERVYECKMITIYQDNIYYLGKKYSLDTLMRYNIRSGSLNKLELGDILSDYRIYHPLAQKPGTNVCGENNGGCSHLCLPNPSENPLYTCECPDDLIKDGSSCISPFSDGLKQNSSSVFFQ